MILALRLAWGIITALIYILVGLAFLPHGFASILTGVQKFLSIRIKRRARTRRTSS